MKFFYRLEYKYGKYAIRNLMYYIVIMYAVGFAIQMVNADVYWEWLALDVEKILHGQVWRLATFLIYPTSSSPFWVVLMSVMYYRWGRTLESVWGAFRFNVYFFLGVLGHILAAFIGYLVFDEVWYLTTGYLNFSLFLAYALTFPDLEFLVFFVLPIKAKWLALAETAVYLYLLIVGSASMRCEILVSLLNVIIFAVLTMDLKKLNPKTRIQQSTRRSQYKKSVKMGVPGHSRHRCSVCGKTEKDDPTLEFRYCSKCEGNHEYCQEHLYTHVHVMKH